MTEICFPGWVRLHLHQFRCWWQWGVYLTKIKDQLGDVKSCSLLCCIGIRSLRLVIGRPTMTIAAVPQGSLSENVWESLRFCVVSSVNMALRCELASER